MIDVSSDENQVRLVESFQELISTPYKGRTNAFCWKRNLVGDFSEIVNKLEQPENIVEIDPDKLRDLQLSQQGQLARAILFEDLQLLKALGAAPVLNLIKFYERDTSYFPTDVYSWHVDRAPIPTSTFLCTYHGASSAILPNSRAEQKIRIPEIRAELEKTFEGPAEEFEDFLKDEFYDLHYQQKSGSKSIHLGNGNLWKLACDYPQSEVPPCIHRAPLENDGHTRLLLIC